MANKIVISLVAAIVSMGTIGCAPHPVLLPQYILPAIDPEILVPAEPLKTIRPAVKPPVVDHSK